jgi:FtsP/CotA-like multicopper oxidase with cupredoxin domain
MTTRRGLLTGAALLGAATVSRAALAALPELHSRGDASSAPPLAPSAGRPYRPVFTLNGWSLPFRMRNGWKEFHLVAEPVEREFSPGMVARLWGYNGQSPGPTIEVVEGDRVRIFVTNRLPEHTTIHWHGQRLPNGMDGVGGLTQPHVKPGKTFVYEFVARRAGTFMYHPHADEMVQMAMGMMGFWVTHPRDPNFMRVDRDFCFLLSSYDVVPGSATPRINTMTEFNMWTWNSRVFPGIDPLVCRRGDRVRVRIGNLTMTNHPIHLHGPEFYVTGTDGGWTPPGSRWPEVTVDVAVGQMRAIEFDAIDPGDWAIHCHKSHHTMGPMGHSVPTMIGVPQDDLADRIGNLIPGYMAMGSAGMAEMGTMRMPLPANTLPMMDGRGQFGPLEMGGMFSVVKVRDGIARDDYRDPGPYRNPPGTVAYEWSGEAPAVQRQAPAATTQPRVELEVRKPGGDHHH